MKLATVQNNGRLGSTRARREAGFTLAECLAALLFMVIVIPVAIQALHIASSAGEVALRKGEAARIADRVLNQSLVMTNWSSGSQSGTANEGPDEFHWTLTTQNWPKDAMEELTAQVSFTTQGRDYSVKMSTLASLQNQSTPGGASGTMGAAQ